ncbi:MAG: type II toxin-antitoxin system VapC family toxin [Actinomycetales bacterium]
MTLVVDASVIVEIALGDDTPKRRRLVKLLLDDGPLVATDYVDIEVANAVGRAMRRGAISVGEAERVSKLVAMLPMMRLPTRALSGRLVELMHNHSAYDSGYIAIAEALRAPLVTLDRGMATSPVAMCPFVLV